MATPDCTALTTREASTVRRAFKILERQLYREARPFTSPERVKQYLSVRYATAPRETFGVLFLDSQNYLIAFEELFHGTLSHTSVYPREVVRAALLRNASAVMFVHNHPSGVMAPSKGDMSLTNQLIEALRLVNVGVLDHFLVAGANCLSFAEHGWLGVSFEEAVSRAKASLKNRASKANAKTRRRDRPSRART